MRLTGLDLKMEQYAAGERFADAVIARARPRLPEPGLDRPRDAALARRDPGAGAVDRAHRGSRVLSEPSTVLATPILGSPLSRELVARIEAVEGVQLRAHRRRRTHPRRRRRVGLRRRPTSSCSARFPASVLDHVVTRAAAAALDPLGLRRRRPHFDAARARARPDRHERARRLQPPDRRVRGDDVARHRAPAAAAPRAPARADVAAAARTRAVRADDRDRRLRQHRRGGRTPAPAVRLPHPRHAPPSRARLRRRCPTSSSSASRTSPRCCATATSSWSPHR